MLLYCADNIHIKMVRYLIARYRKLTGGVTVMLLTDRETWLLEIFRSLTREEQEEALDFEEAILRNQTIAASTMAKATSTLQ